MNTRSAPRNVARAARLSLLALAAVGICAAGCESKLEPHSDFARDDQETEWLAGTEKPPTPKTLYAMTRILIAKGRESEADYMLRKIIQEHPHFMPAYVELAEMHMRHRRIEPAVAVLSAGLKASPNDAVLLNDIGMCWMVKGDYARALTMFKQAAAAMPANARYRGNMALALGMMGRYEESLALYEQLLAPADAHDNLAIICEARKDFERAGVERATASELRAAEAQAKNRAPAPKPKSDAPAPKEAPET